MAHYRIIYPVMVNTKKRTDGVIELSDEDAAGLLACGAIELTDEAIDRVAEATANFEQAVEIADKASADAVAAAEAHEKASSEFAAANEALEADPENPELVAKAMAVREACDIARTASESAIQIAADAVAAAQVAEKAKKAAEAKARRAGAAK